MTTFYCDCGGDFSFQVYNDCEEENKRLKKDKARLIRTLQNADIEIKTLHDEIAWLQDDAGVHELAMDESDNELEASHFENQKQAATIEGLRVEVEKRNKVVVNELLKTDYLIKKLMESDKNE